jgi:hypothetical protein
MKRLLLYATMFCLVGVGVWFTGSKCRSEIPHESKLNVLLEAVRTKSLDKIRLETTPRMQGLMTAFTYEPIYEKVTPRFTSPYTIEYFGRLWQQDADVYIYALRFKGGGDDLKVHLVLQGDKLDGFQFQ